MRKEESKAKEAAVEGTKKKEQAKTRRLRSMPKTSMYVDRPLLLPPLKGLSARVCMRVVCQ